MYMYDVGDGVCAQFMATKLQYMWKCRVCPECIMCIHALKCDIFADSKAVKR